MTVAIIAAHTNDPIEKSFAAWALLAMSVCLLFYGQANYPLIILNGYLVFLQLPFTVEQQVLFAMSPFFTWMRYSVVLSLFSIRSTRSMSQSVYLLF